jgi:methylthioribose-1-phosphate isomerase
MTTMDAVLADRIAAMAAALYQRGWMPGTAGNISARLDDDHALITGSGLSKGELAASDLVVVRVGDSSAVARGSARPSAETTIHTAVYRASGSRAVVHAHPPYATAVSIRYGGPDLIDTVSFEDYELIKGFGLADPGRAHVPVFPNRVEVAAIGDDVESYLNDEVNAPPVMLIAGHGATAWGTSLEQARDRLECLEALCELVLLTGRSRPWKPER